MNNTDYINQELTGDDILYWQRGYGILTISMQDFDGVYNYVKNQKEHHKNDDLWEDFERLNSEDEE